MTVSTVGELSADAMVEFWADAVNGLVRLGRGHQIGSEIIMQWQDPEHHIATRVGLMTGWGSTGTWEVCFPDGDETIAPETTIEITTTSIDADTCIADITTGNTARYDTMLDLTLGSEKAITFSDIFETFCSKHYILLF